MSRILTGIQSSGRPHLGNILGAILPAIELSQQADNDSFLFIADLHSLTTLKEGEARREFVRAIAATWLAFGFDTIRNTMWRQSRVPEHTELAWYLNCFTPMPMLQNATSFKDKSEKLAAAVNAGLFTYPVLQAADILLYDANLVPVGKDQRQHIEMTRDIASTVNRQYGEEIFVLSGTFSDSSARYGPGWYLRNPPGSAHQPSSADGALIFVKLQQMEAGETCVSRIDTRDPAAWRRYGSHEVCPLHTSDHEDVCLRRLPPGQALRVDTGGGAELQCKNSASRRAIFKIKLPTMAFNDGSADVQAKTQALRFGGKKGFKQLRCNLSTDARPRIGNPHTYRLATHKCFNLNHFLIGRQVLHRLIAVHDQIEHHLLQQDLIPLNSR